MLITDVDLGQLTTLLQSAYHRFMICLSALEGSGRVTEHRKPRFSPSFLDVSTESCSGLSN